MKYLAILAGLGLLGFIGYKQFAGGRMPGQEAAAPPPPPPPPAVLDEAPPMVLDAASLERVRASTRDTDPTVRWEAAQFLLNSRDPQGLPVLFEMLQQDSEASIRLKVVQLLGTRSSPEITQYIVLALRDTDAQVRHAALDALANIADYRTSEAISETLHDTDETVRLKALQTLNALQAKRTQEVQAVKTRNEEQMRQWEDKVKQQQSSSGQKQASAPE